MGYTDGLDARLETLDEKHRVEAMVTAILTNDAEAQAVAADGCLPRDERMLRAGAGIIAGIFTALGRATGLGAIEAWRTHMQGTNESRGARG